nr:uncharacterized protein LOC109150426 [Ipomoea batatas]
MGKVESQRSVFDRLGSNPKTSKRKSIHDRLGIVQDVKNNASQHAEVESSKRLRSMIPSRMRRETDIHISCGEVLKVQPRTIVHTRVQKGKNEESVGSSDDVVPPQGEEASSFHITLCDETPIEGEDAEEAPHELEEGVRAAIDELKEVDLGTPENPRPIFISTLLSNEDEEIYVTLLKEYIDVFVWTYKEMPGLDPKVAVHRLAVKKTCRPVKQAQRRFRPELIPSIEGEVNKLIEAGFIRKVKYPTWISSIVPVRKKNGQIRVCVDFQDLNVASPKDDFPLPITELMIDAVTGHEIMSFMDGSSGYNQIRMAPEDEELTAFRTPKGIYCYKVIPFGLKNAGATYQRAMQTIFDDMLHKMVECYVDDLVVKSKLRADHLGHLRKVFDRLRKFQLKMNPLKCAFGVAAGKFLGFAKDVWRISGLPLLSYGVNSFANWVDLQIKKLDMDSCCLMLTLCWKLWMARNDKVWNNKMTSGLQITKPPARQGCRPANGGVFPPSLSTPIPHCRFRTPTTLAISRGRVVVAGRNRGLPDRRIVSILTFCIHTQSRPRKVSGTWLHSITIADRTDRHKAPSLFDILVFAVAFSSGFGEQDDTMPSRKLGFGGSRLIGVGTASNNGESLPRLCLWQIGTSRGLPEHAPFDHLTMMTGGLKSDNGGQRLEKINSQVLPFQNLRVSLVVSLIWFNDNEGSTMVKPL